MKNQIVWVDIPVADLNRAVEFYTKVLDKEVTTMTVDDYTFAILPHDDTNVAGCLVPGAPEQISTLGPLVYLNTDGRLDEAVKIALENGASILEDKLDMGPHGLRVVIKDCEGNRLALHSEQPKS
ncbi:VOC family protein [Thalassotalea atypica]|uniref:VOC family protein n=1 Tax=Thalassotalea atypica TaxID=2054316 RepID=UPI002574033F|nr:VOC family protein [Thalassotalea atypica]